MVQNGSLKKKHERETIIKQFGHASFYSTQIKTTHLIRYSANHNL
jgi:hypothetical protein